MKQNKLLQVIDLYPKKKRLMKCKICRRDLEKKWMDFSSEDDTDFSPEDELHFDDHGEIIDIYTKNELRRLREKPWYDESNKYYYMKTPDGQKFQRFSISLGTIVERAHQTKAIRRTKAEEKYAKKFLQTRLKTWNTIFINHAKTFHLFTSLLLNLKI